MTRQEAPHPEPRSSLRGALRVVVALAAFQAVVLVVATWPAAGHFGTRLIGAPIGPLRELIAMDNLAAGRPAASGSQPIPGLSERAYRLARPLVGRPLVAYNLLWFAGLVLYGTGSALFVLAFVPHAASAALGGMLAMLAAPVLLRSRDATDTLGLAAMAWFLAAYARFVDRPTIARLAVAVVLFALTALGGEPFAIYALVPTIALTCAAALKRQPGAPRTRRPLSPVGLAACMVVLALASRLHLLPWAAGPPVRGDEFARNGVPLWSYVLPSVLHRSSAVTPVDFYHHAGLDANLSDKVSYLGLATLLLMHHAWLRKARYGFRGAVVAAGVVAVLLSCGAVWQMWSWTVPLPGTWLRNAIGILRHVAVPARFNLVASLLAAVVAAAGARELTRNRSRRHARIAAFAGLALLAGLDLATSPFPGFRFPRRSPAVARLLASDPSARLLEAPHLAESPDLEFSMLDLWQPEAGGRHRAPLRRVDFRNSPFRAEILLQVAYVREGAPGSCGLVGDTRFTDYAWLYLHTQGIRYAVVHKWLLAQSADPGSLENLRSALGPGVIDEDPAVLVIDRDRLPVPSRPVLAGADGWSSPPGGDPRLAYASGGTLRVFVPEGAWDLQLTGRARSLRHPRGLRLTDEAGHELAKWDLSDSQDRPLVSFPMPLAPGWHTLTLAGGDPADGATADPSAAQRFSLSAVALDVESLATAGTAAAVQR